MPSSLHRVGPETCQPLEVAVKSTAGTTNGCLQHGRLHQGPVEEPCGHLCAGACISLGHPWCCRSPVPPKATPSQMGEEHLQVRWARDTQGQARRETFAHMATLGSCCLGNLKGSLSGFGVCVPTAEKNGAEANVSKGKIWVMQQLCCSPPPPRSGQGLAQCVHELSPSAPTSLCAPDPWQGPMSVLAGHQVRTCHPCAPSGGCCSC